MSHSIAPNVESVELFPDVGVVDVSETSETVTESQVEFSFRQTAYQFRGQLARL